MTKQPRNLSIAIIDGVAQPYDAIIEQGIWLRPGDSIRVHYDWEFYETCLPGEKDVLDRAWHLEGQTLTIKEYFILTDGRLMVRMEGRYPVEWMVDCYPSLAAAERAFREHFPHTPISLYDWITKKKKRNL